MGERQTSLLPPHMPDGAAPEGAVLADLEKLSHINTYGDLPTHYQDYPFICKDCGSAEVWMAEQQKWYYEEAKGHIWSVAMHCRACRKKRKFGGAEHAI
jgi:hypothetical protein